MSDPGDLARAASDAVDAACKPIEIRVDPTLPPNGMQLTYADGSVSRTIGYGALLAGDLPYAPRDEPVEVTYTTVGDQACAIIGEDDVLQQCIADLVAAGAGEGEARAAVATVVEHALRKGIIGVQ